MKQFNLKEAALMLGATAFVAFSSCSNAEELLNQVEQGRGVTVPVRVQVSAFTMSQSDLPDALTRSTTDPDPAENDNVQELTLAFYAGSTEVFKQIQSKSAPATYETFGEFSCDLPAGTYTMVVVGRDHHDGDEFSLTSPTAAEYTSERARETFCKTQSVTVTNTEALDIDVTLNRVVSLLAVQSTDTRPEEAVKIRVSGSAGSKRFNPTTGFALGNTGFTVVSTPSNAKINMAVYTFLVTDEQTMDITLEVLDASEDVLYRKVIPNVPFRRNRKTTLSGALFSPSATAAAITLNTEWLSHVTVNF